MGKKATGKIFCIMGKSGCGKNTIYRAISEEKSLPLKSVVTYTTRPIREGEVDGVDYRFVSDSVRMDMEGRNKIIEQRAYSTVHGIWIYFTADDGQIDLRRHSSFLVGTLDSFLRLGAYFGRDAVVPIYLEVDPGERLQRALTRERAQKEPKYEELCRRFLSDEEDFSEENLKRARITRRFRNDDVKRCASEVISFMKEYL